MIATPRVKSPVYQSSAVLHSMANKKPTLSGTDLLHADDVVPHGLEVAPSISVTTSACSNNFNSLLMSSSPVHIAFRNPEPWQEGKGLADIDPQNPPRHGYARYTQAVSTRAEHVLSKIMVHTISATCRSQDHNVIFSTGWTCCYLFFGAGGCVFSTCIKRSNLTWRIDESRLGYGLCQAEAHCYHRRISWLSYES